MPEAGGAACATGRSGGCKAGRSSRRDWWDKLSHQHVFSSVKIWRHRVAHLQLWQSSAESRSGRRCIQRLVGQLVPLYPSLDAAMHNLQSTQPLFLANTSATSTAAGPVPTAWATISLPLRAPRSTRGRWLSDVLIMIEFEKWRTAAGTRDGCDDRDDHLYCYGQREGGMAARRDDQARGHIPASGDVNNRRPSSQPSPLSH